MTGRTIDVSSLTPEARRLYHVLLRMVADQNETIGSFPDVSDAHAGGRSDAFGVLVDAGLIEHDTETGLVTAVMPFVAVEPSIVVLLDGDEELQRRAAGVLDAFALPPLLGRTVRIDDQCPTCGEPVRALAESGRVRRKEPSSAVVVRVPSDGSRERRYATARLACSPEHALATMEATGEPEAVMQSIERLSIDARARYAAMLEG